MNELKCQYLANNDNWLENWIGLIKNKCKSQYMLEIGCGLGWDTKILTEAGIKVIAIDKSSEYIEKAKKINPEATFIQKDIREFTSETSFNVVMASLSIHYMTWTETMWIIDKCYKIMNTNGLLLIRVNSVKDSNYGATGFPEIENNFYLVNGKTKRFFDKKTLMTLFDEKWKIISIEEKKINRYEKTKVVWELALIKI